MTALSPTQSLDQSATPPDRMAGAVLQSLSRVAKPGATPGIFRCLLSGILTLALLPMITWPRRVNQVIRYEKDQLWHLTEWLRLRQGNHEMQDLDAAIKAIKPPMGIWMLGWAWGVLNIGWILWAVSPFIATRPGQLIDFWQSAGFANRQQLPWYSHGFSPFDLNLWNAWLLGVMPFYILHWIVVQRHAATVRKYLSAFNRLSLRHGFAPFDAPGVGLGLRPLWIISGLILALCGAWWGLPLMLAGALQRTYSITVARQNRTLLAGRVRAMLGQMRPEMALGKPVWIGERCPNTLCGARLAAAAKYCPRCGQRVNGSA